VNDWTFAYWETSFAESPAPEVILRYQEGVYRPAIELMRQPAPDPAELEEQAQEIRADPEGWQQPSPPPLLWAEMLDLIYSGQAELAWSFLAQAWPPDVPGQEAFLRRFLAQLTTSPFWPELQTLNQNQWPAWLDTTPAETGLAPLPTAAGISASPEFPLGFPAPPNDEAGGEAPGPVEAVFVQGSYAYVPMGATLVVLDISSPAQPRQVGSVALPGQVKDIYVQGNYAYLAKASGEAERQRPIGGLWVVDVSAPEAPTIVSSQEFVGDIDDLTVIEGYLYRVEQPRLDVGLFEIGGRLHSVDISNPAAPKVTGFYELPQGPPEVNIIGAIENYLYLSTAEGGMFILQFD
jgi:hypothetical protein